MRRSWLVQLAIIGLVGCGGCALRPVANIDAFANRSATRSFEVFGRTAPPGAVVLSVPFDQQHSQIACGAHVIASAIRYWRPDDAAATGEMFFNRQPPADRKQGYSLAELIALAEGHGVRAFGVSLPSQGLIAELDQGRPVLIPLRLPSIWEQSLTLLPADFAPVGQVKALAIGRVASTSSLIGLGMGSHFVLVAGYWKDRFVILDPIMGYRTISRRRLERFRRHFSDAALILSAAPNGLTRSAPGDSDSPPLALRPSTRSE